MGEFDQIWQAVEKLLIEASNISQAAEYSVPETETELQLANIWQELLDIKRIGRKDNFFALGGHSLLATQMLSRIQIVFAIDLPVHKLFESPTVEKLALEIERQLKTGSIKLLPLRSVSATKIHLLYNQKIYWVRDCLEGTEADHKIVARTLEIEGDLDVKIFKLCLQTIVERHAILRTILCLEDGIVYQQIDDNATINLKLSDLQKIPQSERKLIAYELLKQEAQKPFNLTQEYLIRYSLSRLSTTSYIFMVNMHHIICDGLSTKIFWQELAAIYNALIEGKPNPLPPLSIQYTDFVNWQQQYLEGAITKTNYQYWSKHLADLSTNINLPYDRPKSCVPTYGQANRTYFKLNTEKTQQLRSFCQERNITLYMMFLATWQLLLHYYSGQTDVFVRSLVSGRDRVETESLIGMFANVLLLRSQYNKDITFEIFLTQVRQDSLEAYTHRHIMLQELLDNLQTGRDPRSPIAPVGFLLDNFSQIDLQMSGLKTQRGSGVSSLLIMTDLQLVVVESEVELLGINLFYNSDLFNESTATQIITEFQQLLNTVIGYPEQTLNELLYISSLVHSPFVSQR